MLLLSLALAAVRKFMVTELQWLTLHRINSRTVRLLCRMYLDLKSVSPYVEPTFSSQKMLLSNLKQSGTLQYRSTSVVNIMCNSIHKPDEAAYVIVVNAEKSLPS